MVDDTISRRAAIEGSKELFAFGDCYCDEYSIVGMLNSLPSAQPEITEDDVKEYCRKRCLIVVTSDFYEEMMKRWSQHERKRGKWTNENGADGWNRCSVCGELAIDLFDFCPNCGADMRGDE